VAEVTQLVNTALGLTEQAAADWRGADPYDRWSFYPVRSPSVINIAFAVGALLTAKRDAGRTDLGDRAGQAALGDQERARDRARRALMRTVADQRPDGLWPYGEGQARFHERFFGPAGEARLWADRRYPEDGFAPGLADGAPAMSGYEDPAPVAPLSLTGAGAILKHCGSN
jgi:hypothetical protein